MADRLELYNDALMLCGEKFLASLSEPRESRRLLDQVWTASGGAIKYCLEQGQWHFAMRTEQIDADPDITPAFGLANGFPKPSDWIATSAVCSDERFNTPLVQYADEIGYWYADITPIYVKFVSNDADYGGDLGKWPATFADYVSAYLASKVIMKLAGDKEKLVALLGRDMTGQKEGILRGRLSLAKNKAAMTQPAMRPAQGSWTRSRYGSGGYRNDRGNPGSLIG